VLSRLEQSISKSSLVTKGQKVKMENKVCLVIWFWLTSRSARVFWED
jgi:hypothetical protein